MDAAVDDSAVSRKCSASPGRFTLEAAALAAQRDAEERYKRLSADVQELLDTQAVLLKRLEESRQRIDRLSDEVRNLKEEHNRTSGNAVSRDEFRKYVEKLKELDEKREADKKLILDNIKSLANLPPPAASDERDKDKGNSRRKNNHSTSVTRSARPTGPPMFRKHHPTSTRFRRTITPDDRRYL